MQCFRCQHENSSRAKFCEGVRHPAGSDLLELRYPALTDRQILPRVCAPDGPVRRAAPARPEETETTDGSAAVDWLLKG